MRYLLMAVSLEDDSATDVLLKPLFEGVKEIECVRYVHTDALFDVAVWGNGQVVRERNADGAEVYSATERRRGSREIDAAWHRSLEIADMLMKRAGELRMSGQPRSVAIDSMSEVKGGSIIDLAVAMSLEDHAKRITEAGVHINMRDTKLADFDKRLRAVEIALAGLAGESQ